jgi:hypothetical protein
VINASTLLKLFPNLPGTTQSILQLMVTQAGNPELHIPGLPSMPTIPAEIPEAVKQVLVAALGDFDFEFYQTLGVKVSRKGVPLGGVGAKVIETLNVKNPAPNVRIIPVLELGSPKE